MSSTTVPVSAGANPFDRTVAELKQGVASATAAQTEASKKVVKAANDVAAFNKGTLEAITQANQIFAAGSQDLFSQMTKSSQAAFAEALSGFRALVTAKTIKERLELQANLARTSATWAVSEGSRFATAGIDLAVKASAPLTARATLAAETFAALKV